MTSRCGGARVSERRSQLRTGPSAAGLSRRAVLRVGADADLTPLEEALVEEERVVLLRDPDRRLEDRRDVAGAVERGAVRLDGPALDQVDRDLGRGSRFGGNGLVDGAALPARKDVLHAAG